MNGRSQAVRLPKEFRFVGSEVLIRKEGENIILSPRPQILWRFVETCRRKVARICASNNLREFSRICGLKCENWV